MRTFVNLIALAAVFIIAAVPAKAQYWDNYPRGYYGDGGWHHRYWRDYQIDRDRDYYRPTYTTGWGDNDYWRYHHARPRVYVGTPGVHFWY